MEPRFGLYVPNQYPRGSNLAAAFERQVDFVHLARELGWDSIWTGQHFLTEETSQLSTIVTLARLAAELGDMELGVGLVLLPLLNPVEVAEHVASLDIVTKGKLILGVGIGYRDVEYAAFGVPKKEAAQRFTANLEILRELLGGDAVTATHPWSNLVGARLAAEPIRVPPIWMGANSDHAVKRAARLADSWLINPHATLSTVVRQLTVFAEERKSEGLPNQEVVPLFREVFCAPTTAEADQLARTYLGEKYQVYSRWGQDEVLADNDTFDGPFADLSDQRFIIGDPERCLRAIESWRDATGANYFVFRTHWSGMPMSITVRSVSLLAREVLPALKR